MNKLFVVGILLLLISGGMVVYENQYHEVVQNEKLFYGPVPQGFNETHFRQTGETIPLLEAED